MDRHERIQEAREDMSRESISVCFTVECESFRVPGMHELEFSATYEAIGVVTLDCSGDHITPNGPPNVRCSLLDMTAYDIKHYEDSLPKWLQQHLATEFASEVDAAFLEAIGGQDRLNELAIEKANA